MARHRKHRVLWILLSIIAFIALGAGGFILWLSHHYRDVLKAKLPELVAASTDSVYHISFKDVEVSIVKHKIVVTDLKLWPDKQQVAALKKANRHVPPTLSTVSIPQLDAYGLEWNDLISDKSLDCEHVEVYHLKWDLDCRPNPLDSLTKRDPHKNPKISRITAQHVHFTDPNVAYHYTGPREHFDCYMKDGAAELHNWVYNYDQKKDTSIFLYAHSGKLRLDSFVLVKANGRYGVKKPLLDFESTENSVTLKNVKLRHLTDRDPKTGSEKEWYDLSFPAIIMSGFSWSKLIYDNQLVIPSVNAESPDISDHYIRENATKEAKGGSYPSQLLLQVGIHTNISNFKIEHGHLQYIEHIKDDNQGVIEFTGISGKFTNVTNMKDMIAHKKNCLISLKGKYSGKSPVSATFDFNLADTLGKFKVDGFVENLDGDDVMKQVQAFTFIEVTSFHLSHMDMHLSGDEKGASGDFTMLYNGLKISMFKFKSNLRKGKHGPMSFLGSALVLYPDNPMKDQEPRKVSTFFYREPSQGFISLLWKNIYRGAKKTAVRHEGLINMTDGKEDTPGEPPHKKGLLARLFHKKKK